MKYLTFALALTLLSLNLMAADELCITGGRILSLEKTSLNVKAQIAGKLVSKDLVAERTLGSEGKKNYFNILGFFTFDEMRQKFCDKSITDQPVIYYPSYEAVIGQNGFYWYLDGKASGKATHLLLVEGREKEGRCEDLLEGATYHVIACK